MSTDHSLCCFFCFCRFLFVILCIQKKAQVPEHQSVVVGGADQLPPAEAWNIF